MVDLIISFAMAALAAIASIALFAIGKKMLRSTLAPNDFMGVRTKNALRSHDNWHLTQSSCAPYVLMLAVAYLNSTIIFAIQGIWHECIPLSIPVAIFALESAAGIALIHHSARKKATPPRS